MGLDPITRRDFLVRAAGYGLFLGGAGLLAPRMPRFLTDWLSSPASAAERVSLEEILRTAPVARYWASTADPDVSCASCHTATDLRERGYTSPVVGVRHAHADRHARCQLCARGCVLSEGERGECSARMLHGGEIRSLVYGRPVAVHVDPIEKKPFYHFMPGSVAFSLSTTGCPLHCEFCQNWELSQARPEDYGGRFVPPDQVAAAAVERTAPIVAFTYNEPTVFTEYLTDIARAARPLGLKSAVVSCGFMTEAPLAEMCEVLDAIKIDLKGFSPEFYRKVSHAEIEPVLRSLKQVARSGRHLEIVNLVVPTLNDSEAMLHGLADWVVDECGPDVPVHFTRFHPDYKLLNLAPTPIATLERARAIAMERGIRYAYVGNVPGHPGNHTYCPGCGRIVIERQGFFVGEMHLEDGKCSFCQTAIAGLWS